MPQQLTLATQADTGFEAHRKTTRRDGFLAEMGRVVPWADLCAVIEPFYPEPCTDGCGRPTVGLERMLRIHFLQQWYALSDPAVEEALHDSAAMRRFVGIDPVREATPVETTVCKFRHLLERHGLAAHLFAAVSTHLKQHGFKLSQGTIVDATIIAVAPSTKNKAKARDKEMHQTRKDSLAEARRGRMTSPTIHQSTAPVPLRFLRLPEVMRLTGLSRTTVYARIAAGSFPKPIHLGTRAVAWIEDEILQWMAACIAVRDGASVSV